MYNPNKLPETSWKQIMKALWLDKVFFIIIILYLIAGIDAITKEHSPPKESFWLNNDPSRHPWEIRKYDTDNRIIIWKNQQELDNIYFKGPFVKELKPSKETKKGRKKADIEIDDYEIEDLIEQYLD